MHATFDHEKRNVYQDAIRFASWADALLEALPKNLAVHDQLDRASTSIPLNLVRIVSMLVGLVRSTSDKRLHEDRATYDVENESAREYDYAYDYD